MLVGVMTVFTALFLIILFLLGFPGFFAALERRKQRKLAPISQHTEEARQSVPTVNQTVTQEDEALVAVLTAAVAAASGTGSDSFKITQVCQTPVERGGGFNTPVWGRVERLLRN